MLEYFVYQPTIDTLELKKNKGTDYVFSWKSTGLYTSKLKPLYTAFLHSIRFPEYRMGIKFDKDPLAVERNSYGTKIVKAYIVYDLDAWPNNSLNKFKLQHCLFGETNIVKNSDKESWIYGGYWIAFDGVGLWNFGNEFAKNVVIFGVDNSSLSRMTIFSVRWSSDLWY